MLVRKFRTKYIDNNPAFQKDLDELEKASPLGLGMNHTRYLSIRSKGIFDKVNQSVVMTSSSPGQAMKNNYFNGRHASVGPR